MTQHGDSHDGHGGGHGPDAGHGAPGGGHDAHGSGGGGHGHDDPGHGGAPAPALEKKSTPGAVLIGFLVLLAGELVIFSHSGISLPEILPENISTYGRDIDHLFYVILAITGFFFLLTEGLLVYFVLRYRARPGEKAKHTHGSHTLEMVWTFIPGVILFGLAIFQTSTWQEIKFKKSLPDAKDAYEVQVLGKQFEWLFRYPGADRKFGTDDDLYSNAELHVPVNRKVIVHLQTLDVLHSFWLPNVRLKQDLLPGRTIPQWFECVKTGTYTIVCAELCGSGHTKMGGHLIVDTPEKTEEWLRTREPGADSQSMKSWKEWKVRAAR